MRFVDGAFWAFESRISRNYHTEINSESFEKWFEGALNKIERYAVIIMDMHRIILEVEQNQPRFVDNAVARSVVIIPGDWNNFTTI